MPTRPRSHQIETVSLTRFKALLPEAWVCRDKSHDYGVDLEVEIFNTDGSSTGLTFNVQMKATESEAEEQTVTMLTDRLNYLSSLDAPSVIFRYCLPKNTFYWCWIFDAIVVPESGKKSKSVEFGDGHKFRAESWSEIERTLRVLRLIRFPDRRTRFPLVASSSLRADLAITCEKIISEINRKLPYTTPENGYVKQIPIYVHIEKDIIELKIDSITSLSISAGGFSEPRQEICILYGLTSILDHYGFGEYSAMAAEQCLKSNTRFHSKDFGLTAALSLLRNPDKAVDLAILNGIHELQDIYYANFVSAIIKSDTDQFQRLLAIQNFYRAALESTPSPSEKAAISYSLGNSFSNIGAYSKAVRAFNDARKFDVRYIERAYFLRELGGALYLGRRFSNAAHAYKHSILIDRDSKTVLCFGDACLFSGQFAVARNAFLELENDSNETLSLESRIKFWLANYFLEITHNLNEHRSNLFDIIKLTIESDIEDSEFAYALTCAFHAEDDIEIWAYCIMYACARSDEVIEQVMMCASVRCGMDAYSRFKEISREMQPWPTDLDEMQIKIYSLHEKAKPPKFTGRIIL